MRIALAVMIVALSGCWIGDDDFQVADATRCTGFGYGFDGSRYVDSTYFGLTDLWGETSGVKPVALGGTEGVSITPGLGSGARLESSGAQLELGSGAAQQLVTGATEGVADVCVVKGGGVEDGQAIAVREVARMDVVPASGEELAVYPLERWVMFAGLQQRVGVALTSREGWRLVDDGMTIAVTADRDGAVTSRAAWDEQIADLHPGSWTVTSTLTSGETHAATLEVVGEVDEIVRESTYPPADDLRLGWGESMCFTPMRNGAVVVGAPFELDVSDNIQLNTSYTPNCAAFVGMALGAGEIVARVGAVELRVPVTVVPPP